MAASAAEGRHPGREPQPALITDARSGSSRDFASRQRNYMIAMGARTVLFLLSTILYLTNVIDGWLCWLMFGAAVVLPSVAVALANQANTSSRGQPTAPRGEPSNAPQLTTGAEVISGTIEDEQGPVPQHDDATDDRGHAA